MGVSLFNFTGWSAIRLNNSHQKNSMKKMDKQTSKFKFLKPRGRVFMCKSEFEERTSPDEQSLDNVVDLFEKVKKEIQNCYALIHKLGRGVVYLGSSRMGPGHPHYMQTVELAREARVGPGLMDAATKGALQAKKPVGGFKIGREAGEWTTSQFHPYLPSETYLTCRFFSARKHGLVDAAMRCAASDRTAVIALPGGVGTLDEMFEILALIQLERVGSEHPVPFLVMNYDLYYSKLLAFFDDCEDWGTVSKGEVGSLWKVCNGNTEALEYLREFYSCS
ncbi:hypothetical protein IFM89_021574 [Coptis chinensis]|uniref:Cytokinin riboside 5'-monophosphate phosphoribohydrolase n=1 Tax=Coptis chinensis TaxID=261450 RepID=A0A835I0B1_9MAGN|nr:hypothetical protein IFM89_021574 [Coptis chinensis]